MANNAGRAARRTAPANKRRAATAKAAAGPVKHAPSPLAAEIKYICLAALGVLLLLSVYTEGAVGAMGRWLSSVFIGLFGFGAYALPFITMAAALYGLFSATKRLQPVFAVKLLVFFWNLIALVHITAVKTLPEYPGVFAYFQDAYATGAVGNGGLLGALLGNLLRGLLSPVGAYIVLIAGLLISLVLLTGRSFVMLTVMAVRNLRGMIGSMFYTDGEDGEYWHEGQTLPAKNPPAVKTPQAPPEKNHAQAATPAKIRKRKTTDSPPEPYTIDDSAHHRGPHRVLLVNEEMDGKKAPHPLFKPRKEPAGRKIADDLREARQYLDATDLSETYKIKHSQEEYPPDDDYESEYVQDDYEGDDYPHEDDLNEADLLDEPLKIEVRPPARNSANPADTHTLPARRETAPAITLKGLVDGCDDDYTDSIPDTPFDPDTTDSRVIPFPQTPKEHKPSASAVSVPAQFGTSFHYDDYQFPPISLLTESKLIGNPGSRAQILDNSRILEETLKSFRVEARVVEVSVGPTVTRYDMAPGPGVKVASIANLANDLALSLAAQGIRIEAPIPGKAAVGIEVPNKEPQPVLLREIVEDESFQKFHSKLAFAVGKDIAGAPVVTDVARMPHLLIAGATGSGKSVCINTLIASLLYKARPDEVKLLMIDPKVVELSVYNGIPHLMIPVVTDPKKASGALNWAVSEMDNRYNQFAETGVRDLKGYNALKDETGEMEEKLPQIVIIIDELADLMMVCKGEVEEAICRLAQKARAAGIHLIIATQRPSVDVITGLIKANIPSRLAFAVSSGIDSRTVLDMYGAEKLLGKGDMLFLPMGQNKPIRLQGGYISDKEVESLVDFLKQQTPTEYTPEMIEQVTTANHAALDGGELDEFFYEAVEFLLEKGKASTSLLQRQFRIGYNRASRLMEDLESRGIVGPEDGVKPRKIMVTREEFYNMYG